MVGRFALLALLLALCSTAIVRADDSGPRRDVARVRSDAVRLLAHYIRQSGVDPKNIVISSVAVSGDQATLSWNCGKARGTMALTRRQDRWWETAGPNLRTDERNLSGYGVNVHFSPSEPPNAALEPLYARAPTTAEFLPNPIPPRSWGGPTSVGYFDLTIAADKPVTFGAGTTIDVWAPFVLDDSLRYNLTFFSADKPYGPYYGTIFDNVLHFELPAFIMVPGSPLAAEIDGWY